MKSRRRHWRGTASERIADSSYKSRRQTTTVHLFEFREISLNNRDASSYLVIMISLSEKKVCVSYVSYMSYVSRFARVQPLLMSFFSCLKISRHPFLKGNQGNEGKEFKCVVVTYLNWQSSWPAKIEKFLQSTHLFRQYLADWKNIFSLVN